MNKNQFDFNVILDSDENKNYETNSLARKITNFIIIPTLNHLPVRFRKLIRKSHASADDVIENATTHKALEVLYSHGHPKRSKGVMQKLFHYIWFHSNNSRGVRNRLRLVRSELKTLFKKNVEMGKEISVLSIASGSARAVIEALDEVGASGKVEVNGIFLDKNPEAISYSESLTKELIGDNHNLKWVNNTVGGFFNKTQPENSFDVVEMVGLLDYFDDEKTVDTFKKIHLALKPGGSLVTANIVHNSEERFVTHVIGWSMIYRTAEELAKLLQQAGFSYDKMKVFYEPLKVHTVIVARK